MAVLTASALAAGCDQLGLGPHEAVSAPEQAVQPPPDVRPGVGQTYADFVSHPEFERYSLHALGAGAAAQARFAHAMAARPEVGLLAEGGGAQALVFSGCAPSGCLEGLSVVAIDTQTGEVFAGVSDLNGQEKLVANDRLEALLRLTSPSQSWDDPVRPAPG
ncbi:MAG: hypothetical protein R3C25_02035 [Hyphomonadaceae bacterium]